MPKPWLTLAATALIAAPAAALAQATPPEGVPTQVRRGFFTETDVGVFFTLGGEDTYSNAQSYLQLGVGYDFSDKLSLGLSFATGASAANCFAGYLASGECAQASNFTLSFFNATAAYMHPLRERLYLSPKLTAGYTRLDPRPKGDGDAQEAQMAPNFGAGVGLEYASLLDHFSVGADLMVRYVVGPNIPAVAVFPRVKYTF